MKKNKIKKYQNSLDNKKVEFMLQELNKQQEQFFERGSISLI